MLSKNIEDILAERIVSRMQEVNELILNEIGKSIKEVYNIKPSEAYKIQQILKYRWKL